MIFCVEDDESIRSLELYALNAAGFEDRGFEDGGSFLEALQTEKPELVLLDVMLPGTSGVELLKLMRQPGENREIPVIMATARGAEYDKIHLFTYAKEEEHFQPGNHLCRFTLDGQRCALIICYDLRFPELTRTLAVEGLDLLFVPAQWPDKRSMHLQTLARARAIENQMFLVLCNSVGTAGSTKCGGGSAVIDPWGEYLARARDEEEVITAEADFGVLEGIRSGINVFRDRRPELYF